MRACMLRAGAAQQVYMNLGILFINLLIKLKLIKLKHDSPEPIEELAVERFRQCVDVFRRLQGLRFGLFRFILYVLGVRV